MAVKFLLTELSKNLLRGGEQIYSPTKIGLNTIVAGLLPMSSFIFMKDMIQILDFIFTTNCHN